MRVTGKEPIVALEATALDLFNGIRNFAVDKVSEVLVKYECRDTNPGSETLCLSLLLESLGNLNVIVRFVVRTTYPNDSNFFTGSGFRGAKNMDLG
jgi:hypothetical protein